MQVYYSGNGTHTYIYRSRRCAGSVVTSRRVSTPNKASDYCNAPRPNVYANRPHAGPPVPVARQRTFISIEDESTRRTVARASE